MSGGSDVDDHHKQSLEEAQVIDKAEAHVDDHDEPKLVSLIS